MAEVEDFTKQPGYQLAKALEALWRENEAFSELRADHKASVEGLQQEVNRLKQEILTGQRQLPLEPMTPEQLAADPSIQEGLRGLQELADKDGSRISVRLNGGEEVVLAEPRIREATE